SRNATRGQVSATRGNARVALRRVAHRMWGASCDRGLASVPVDELMPTSFANGGAAHVAGRTIGFSVAPIRHRAHLTHDPAMLEEDWRHGLGILEIAREVLGDLLLRRLI